MFRPLAARACALVVLSLLLVPAPATSQTTVDLKAHDGVPLKATYFDAGRPGPGLLLLHACNRDRTSWTGVAKAAASRGFHVLALDFRGFGESGGPRFENFQQQQGTVEADWPRDVDVAFAWLSGQSGVDRTRIAAAGASCGVNQSVLLARRHPEVRTVVLLSGGVTEPGRTFLRDSPWLPVFASASHGDGGAVETMKWVLGWSRSPSNRFLEYKAAGHGSDMFAVEKGLEPAVLAWLDQHLRQAPATRPAAVAPSKPTAIEEFWTAISQPGGGARARQMYEDARRRDRHVVLFPEGEANLLGYQFLQGGNATDALAVFQLNVEAYPASANTYDSLSDAYVALGKKDEALKYAARAIEALDKDTEATPEFKRLVRESAEKKLKELK
jgi:pimeloyl-ACP methyl ester carboxylesterase